MTQSTSASSSAAQRNAVGARKPKSMPPYQRGVAPRLAVASLARFQPPAVMTCSEASNSGRTESVRRGRWLSISDSQVARATRPFMRMASSMPTCPQAKISRPLARPPHSDRSGQSRLTSSLPRSVFARPTSASWFGCSSPRQCRSSPQASSTSTTPQRKSARFPARASSTTPCMMPYGRCMVLRHSIEPRTARTRPSASVIFLLRVTSCAASHTSGSKSSTSSQRSFCTRVPRTETCDCARSSTSEPLRRRRRRSVVRPLTRPASSGFSKSRRRWTCMRRDCSMEPPSTRISMPGLKTRSSMVATALRNVFPPPRLAQTTASSASVQGASFSADFWAFGSRILNDSEPSKKEWMRYSKGPLLPSSSAWRGTDTATVSRSQA